MGYDEARRIWDARRAEKVEAERVEIARKSIENSQAGNNYLQGEALNEQASKATNVRIEIQEKLARRQQNSQLSEGK
jgi:hypothetical protein